MIRDNKDWIEAQIEQIEEMAFDLAKGGRYHYFEDFVDRLIQTTKCMEIFFDRTSVIKHFHPIYRDAYNSRGGI